MIEKTETAIPDETEIDIPKKPTECCGYYLQGKAEIDRFIKNASIRDNNDIYRGKPFEYCPWCGEKK